MLGVHGFDNREGIFHVFTALFGGQRGLMGGVPMSKATAQV